MRLPHKQLPNTPPTDSVASTAKRLRTCMGMAREICTPRKYGVSHHTSARLPRVCLELTRRVGKLKPKASFSFHRLLPRKSSPNLATKHCVVQKHVPDICLYSQRMRPEHATAHFFADLIPGTGFPNTR